jgi:phosphoenolpyruvate phosphomutase
MVPRKAQNFRQSMSDKDLLIGVGARDALDARIIECAGFDFIWSSSLGVSASFAVPDASLISMNQYVEAARSMNQAVDIPIIVDADTGYGNANNLIYAVKLIEEAGIAGMSIEDKKFPKDNSLLAGGRQELARIEEFAGKIMAAKDTQQSADFLVIARVEALIAGWGLEEAHKRATRYAEAGADCILIHSKSTSSDEIVQFIKAWNCKTPLVLVPTTYPDLTEEKIRSLGNVGMVIYANQVFRAAIRAEEEILLQIRRAGGVHTIAEMMAPVEHLFDLQRVRRMKEQEKKYLL